MYAPAPEITSTTVENPSRAEILKRAKDLSRKIKPFAEDADRLRRIPPEVLELIVAADLTPAMSPRSYGGYEVDWMTYIEIVSDIARVSGSIGWCTAFLINHLWFLHFFEKETVDAVYAKDQRPRVCTSFAPFGKARAVPGGYKVEGAWPFGSGGDHCDWALVGATMGGATNHSMEVRMFLLRRDQFHMKDTWHSVGLKGSGSNTIVVPETFVEEAWSLDMLIAAQAQAPGNRNNSAYIFKHSVGPGLALGIYGAVWGVAKGALECFLDFNRERFSAYDGQKLAETQALQIRVGESACEIDAAFMIAEHIDALARRGQLAAPHPGIRAQVAHGVQLMQRGVDRLFKAAGARGLSEQLPLQRHWRDIHAMSNHAGLSPDNGYQFYGRELMGIDAASK